MSVMSGPHQLWNTLYAQKEKWGYFNLATTSDPPKNGSRVNECGLRFDHAFPIIDLFLLRNEEGHVTHRMLMLRDPRAIRAFTKSNRQWNVNDTVHWTEGYRG